MCSIIVIEALPESSERVHQQQVMCSIIMIEALPRVIYQQQVMCPIIVIETLFLQHFSDFEKLTTENKCSGSGLLVLV
jgi:hypothetical protein